MRFERLRAFLKAEEVPRWFGLSVVLIYLVGIASVSRLGIVQARREAQTYYSSSSQFAVESLLARLRLIAESEPNISRRNILSRLAMREFVASIPESAATLVNEKGEPVIALPMRNARLARPVDVDAFASGSGDLRAQHLAGIAGRHGQLVYRATITPGSAAADGGPTADAPDGPSEGGSVPTEPNATAGALFLEVGIPAAFRGSRGLADQFSVITIVFIVLGALFVVYRCLREQLRGVSRIARRLESRNAQVEDDLAALRITDSKDQAVASWNELIDMIVSTQSIAQRTAADEELSRVLQKSGGGALAEALHAVPDAILYIVNETRIEYANSAACRYFGWDVRNVRGSSLIDQTIGGAAGTALKAIRESLQEDGTYAARTETIEEVDEGRSDGGTFRMWVIPLERARHEGQCVVLIRDVSQQVRADKAREELVTQVTHELRTPLTNIRAYAETLASGMFDDPNTITECYNVITKETRRLSRLIEDILSISQIEVGGIDLNLDQVDLRTLLTEAARDVRGVAEEKNIDLQVALPSKLEPVRGDRDKLAVVLNNLLGNAIKYTPADGNVIVGCQVSAKEVLLTIKDNGIGISPEEQGRVFEKFYRAANAETAGETGTGIGLFTAREIVRRHGGEIELISEPNAGSTFMVRLPHEGSRASTLSAGSV